MSGSPTVSVVICAFTLDRWADLRRAAASVASQTLAALETIVVVDGNVELLARVVNEIDGVTALANAHQPGLSGGRRTGGEQASGEIVAFLDDDAIADIDWLAEMAPAFGDPHVLGVGGFVEPLWREVPPPWLPAEFNWVVGCTYAGLPERNGRIRNPIGANMSIRRDVLQRAGGFAPALSRTNRGKTFAGTAEETEYCIRAARIHPGGYWAYRPRARVRHVVPAQRATWRYFVQRCRVEGNAKAVLAGLAGTSDGLSTERSYVCSALPRALVRELGFALRGRPGSLGRAGALVLGLGVTTAAYARTRISLATTADRASC
jgi:glycosyltransferase involved in cell wall biosynthesis